MKDRTIYLNFVRQKGESLSKIYSGSNDYYALPVDEALRSLDILRQLEIPIVVGEFFSKQHGEIDSIVKLWGSRYFTLDWDCTQKNNEKHIDYVERSLLEAKNKIQAAIEVAKKMNLPCYVLFTIGPDFIIDFEAIQRAVENIMKKEKNRNK